MIARLATILGLLAAPAAANTAISDVDAVREGLIAAGIVVEVSEKCPDLAPRKVAGIAFLFSLRDRAREAGFSNAEIEAYIDNATEKKRLEAIARRRLARAGVVEGEPQTYCQFGRAEIARGTTIGSYLRER